MPRTDTAAVALRPLIDLSADAHAAPAMLGEAALLSAAGLDPVGWLPWHRPGRELRALLIRSGLVKPGDPLAGPAPLIQRVSRAGDADGDPVELLWAARLYRQLGRYRECAATASRITGQAPAEVRGWRDLLLAECADAEPGVPPGSGGASGLGGPDESGGQGGPGAPAGVLGLAASLAQLATSPSSDRFADARRRADQLPEDWERTLGRARILALLLGSGGDGIPDGLCADLAGYREAGRDDFLLREGEFALRMAAAERSLAASDAKGAGRHAQAALALDPASAGGHLLAARAAVTARDTDEARRRYRSATRLGLAERHAALCGLADLAIWSVDPSTDVAVPGVVADLLSHDPAPEADRLQALDRRGGPLAETIVADTIRWARAALRAAPATDVGPAPAPAPDVGPPARALRRPLPLERYRPFLDLRPPEGLEQQDWPPIAMHAPLISYAAVLHRREPWFEEIHLQRATTELFRTELAQLAALSGYPSDGAAADFDRWLHAPDGCPAEVREMILGAAELPLLQRSLLARLVSALGFHVAARDMLPGPRVPVTGPESGYALASWLAAEQLRAGGRVADLDPDFRRLYGQLSDDPRDARTRVVTTIDAALSAARRRDPATIASWRAAGERALAQYVARPEVGGFHAALITSRWYRAMGFLPFLARDHDQLRSDMDWWLGIATDLVGHDDHTQVLAADNYFLAVEAAIQAHLFLGDRGAARQLADKLATEIDPIDPKTWLTTGELRYQAGDVTGARDAYQRAAHLEFPDGRLSWFNAGQCHEQLGDVQEAAECYRRSLAHWPTGVTPLRRLRDLAVAGSLGTDSPLVLAWAAGQAAWASLPAPAGGPAGAAS
jgi:Tfp pilus assembly protein PilF